MKKVYLSVMVAVLALITSCAAMKAGPVSYGSGDTTLKGFLAYDNTIKGKRPGILVVHEWWGHNEYARTRAKMLADLGYTALAVDMYGDGKVAEHPKDAGAFANEIRENMDIGRERFQSALELLKRHPSVDPDKIAAIGYCFGGSVVLQMARDGIDLKGVVSFHGSLSTTKPAIHGKVKARILVLNGADDVIVSVEQKEAFKKEMENAGASYRFVEYSGAKHSFTNPDADRLAKEFSLPLAYDKDADERSWKEMQELFIELFYD